MCLCGSQIASKCCWKQELTQILWVPPSPLQSSWLPLKDITSESFALQRTQQPYWSCSDALPFLPLLSPLLPSPSFPFTSLPLLHSYVLHLSVVILCPHWCLHSLPFLPSPPFLSPPLPSPRCLRLLTAAGGDSTHRDAEGCDPLYRAALGGHDKCVRVLLDSGMESFGTNNVSSGGLVVPIWAFTCLLAL